MKNYGIDIESPQGEVVTSIENANNEHLSIDIEVSDEIMNAVSKTDNEVSDSNSVSDIPTAEEYIAKKRHHIGLRAQRTIANSIIYILLVLMTIIWLLPFVGIVFDSFRCRPGAVEGTFFNGPASYFIPKAGEWGFNNYVILFKETKFLKWFGNTFIMGVAVSVVQTIFVLAMSYVLSRMRFKGRKGLMNFMLVLGMFPGFLTLILMYKLMSDFGLTGQNSIGGLILVYCASSGMGYYVSKGYFDTIPRSLDEAARVDGATRAQVMFKIIMPMAKPIIIYTVLMGFMAPWGEFVMAKYIAHNNEVGFNVAVGMQQWMNKEIASKYTVFCAGGVIVALPVAGLFMALQKYYVAGVTGGAVKG